MIWFVIAAFGQTPVDAAPPEPLIEETPAGPDRSQAPPVEPPSPLALDDLTRRELAPGVDVWSVRVPRVRKATVEIMWWNGGYVEMSPSGFDPAVQTLGAVWDLGSAKYDGDALSLLEDTREIAITSSVGEHWTSVEVEAPVEELAFAIEVLADVVFNPSLPKREIKLHQENADRYWHTLGPTSPASVASSALSYAWNPADHPYGWRPDPARYLKVKQPALFEAHRRLIATGPASVFVVGDVDLAEIEPLLKQHFGGARPSGERARALDAPMPNKTRVIAVDMPKSEQALIRLRMPAPGRTHEDRVPLMGASWALGGHFLARFNKNLREDKGWTYGVRAGYSAGEKRGSYSVSVDVPADRLADAVTEIEREFGSLVSDGVTPEEIDAMWRAAVTDYNSARGTSDDAYYFYYENLTVEEDVAARVARIDALAALTPEVTRDVAGRVFGPDAPRVWVVVGPRAALESGLTALGWEAEWVQPSDAILGRLAGGPL